MVTRGARAFAIGDVDPSPGEEIAIADIDLNVYAAASATPLWTLPDIGRDSLAIGQVDRDPAIEIVVGNSTPSHVSPEQARGEPLDGRTDVFAIGAVLYHIVAR